MGTEKKITVSWSGGKDSALALYRILREGDFDVVHLHTIINEETRRVGMHGIPEALIDDQANALGIPLLKCYLPASESHEDYERLIGELYSGFAAGGISHVVFGDIFLEDLKQFREKHLASNKLSGIFPLWGISSDALLHEFLDSGFKTLVCATNESCFNGGILGTVISRGFEKALPHGVDPCGENGEFHTFLFDGPIFHRPVAWRLGEVVSRSYHYQVKDADGTVRPWSSKFYFQEVLFQ